MLEAVGLFILALVLLALGGDSIVKGSAGLAQRAGASPFVAGLLLVAFGTSVPELAVNARAVSEGQSHLALGNAVGSNVVNLGLTLGLAALAAPLLLRARMGVPLLVLLAVATFALMAFGLDGYVNRIEGAVLLLGFVASTAFLLRQGRREADEVQAEIAAFATTRTGLAIAFGRLASARDGAALRVADAFRAHPEYASGTDRDELVFHREVPGLVCKLGAEGAFAIGLADGTGIAIKIADGNHRGNPPVLVAVLDALGLATDALRALDPYPVLGHGDVVGRVSAAPGFLDPLSALNA